MNPTSKANEIQEKFEILYSQAQMDLDMMPGGSQGAHPDTKELMQEARRQVNQERIQRDKR